MSKRTRIGKRYVTRTKDGQFKTNVDVGRSLSADRRSKSKNTVKAGRGHQGDIKRADNDGFMCTICGAHFFGDECPYMDKHTQEEIDYALNNIGSLYHAETFEAEGGCGCGANSSMGGETFAACGCGSKKKAETFGSESRFDTLANKVAKDYESKGYSDKEAMEIGKKVAYSQGVKKYGKAGMTRLSKEGRKKSMQKSADSYSLNAESGQVNTMQATQSWQNSEPYATLEGYNPVDSVIASPPLGRGATQDFGAEYEGHQGYDDKMDESMGMRHRGKHSQSMKDRRDEASAMDKRHSKMGRKYDDVMTMDAEYDSPYGPRQTTDFGMVGMGNDFAQNRAETFSAEGGSEFMTGARYGAGAVIGITGATLILGTVMNLFMRK